MSALRTCGPCARGDHDQHIAHEGPPGALGGISCPCPGDCEGNDEATVRLLESIFGQQTSSEETNGG